MKLLLNVLICCVFLAALGCSPVYYQPNLMNMPNFRKKGEVYLATNLGGNGGDAQVAYSFSDHFMVQGNYMEGVYKDSTRTITLKPKSSINIKGNLGEFALGYFTMLSPNETFCFLGGYGRGKIDNDWGIEGSSSANFNKLFIQSNYGLRYDYFEIVTSLKLANLTYYNQEQSFKNQTFIDQFDVIRSPIPIVEAGMTIRGGGKNIKLQLQGTIMRPFKFSAPEFQYQVLTVGIGICVQLNGSMPYVKKPDENKVRYELF